MPLSRKFSELNWIPIKITHRRIHQDMYIAAPRCENYFISQRHFSCPSVSTQFCSADAPCSRSKLENYDICSDHLPRTRFNSSGWIFNFWSWHTILRCIFQWQFSPVYQSNCAVQVFLASLNCYSSTVFSTTNKQKVVRGWNVQV